MTTSIGTLLISNGGTKPLEVHLEPWPELHTLQPTQRIDVCVERATDALGPFFEIKFSEGEVVVYPAGSMNYFVDIFAMRDGERLESEI